MLGIFLGNLGVGRFYLGYTTLGVLQLLFSWLTCGLWGLIDGIFILIGNVPDARDARCATQLSAAGQAGVNSTGSAAGDRNATP